MNEYQKRINRVLDYIENNMDKNLTLEELADVSCFSRFHFARIFASMMGETLFQFIQRGSALKERQSKQVHLQRY